MDAVSDTLSRVEPRLDSSVITSVDNARVKEVVRLAGARAAAEGLFVAEGPREVGRARAAGLRDRRDVLRAGTARMGRGRAGERARAREDGLPGRARGGARRRRGARTASCRRTAALYLVAVGIEKPGNLGAMARTAEAAGADALVVAEAAPTRGTRTRSERRPAPSSRCRSSRRRSTTSRAFPWHRRRRRRRTRPATPTPTSRGPTAIVVGAEDDGPRGRWLDAADARRLDPASPAASADSLNAATAAAILLFEAVRQRG